MTDFEKQKQKKTITLAIVLGVIFLLALFFLLIPTLRSQFRKEAPMFEPAPSGTAPSPSSSPTSSAAPSKPGPVTSSAPSAAAVTATAPSPATTPAALPAPGVPPAATPAPAAGGAAQSPVALLDSPTTDWQTKLTIMRMLGVSSPAEQVTSPRVKVVKAPPAPRVPFFDPASGYGWGGVFRDSNSESAAWRAAPPVSPTTFSALAPTPARAVYSALPRPITPTTPAGPAIPGPQPAAAPPENPPGLVLTPSSD